MRPPQPHPPTSPRAPLGPADGQRPPVAEAPATPPSDPWCREETCRHQQTEIAAKIADALHNVAPDHDPALAVRSLLAETWAEARAVERAHAARVRDYHHWSAISAGPPMDPPNPYREGVKA